MRSYRFHQLWIGLFLALYLALGATFRVTRASGEVFPFFSWTLFIYVPGTASEYEVELVELAGERFDPPRPLHAARGLVPGAGRISAQVVVQRMGEAASRGDADALARLRRLFERRYLAAGRTPVRYRLVQRYYDPIARFRQGAIESQVEIARFAAGHGAS